MSRAVPIVLAVALAGSTVPKEARGANEPDSTSSVEPSDDATRPPPDRPSGRALVIAGTTLVGVGVVALGGGAAFHVLSSRALDRYENAPWQTGPTGYSSITWSEAKSYQRESRRMAIGVVTLYSLSALAIPVGAVLLATKLRRDEDRHRIRFQGGLTPKGVGFSMRVGF